MSQALTNQFTTHDIVQEVLNKPKEKKAVLSKAFSMKPYINPNAYFSNKRVKKENERYDSKNK